MYDTIYDMAATLLHTTADQLPKDLKEMIFDAEIMTNRLGGKFVSRQALAAIIVCWKHSQK